MANVYDMIDMKHLFLFLFLTFVVRDSLLAQNKNLVGRLKRNKNLIALWDFKEPKGENRKSLLGAYALSEMDGEKGIIVYVGDVESFCLCGRGRWGTIF